MKTSITLDDKVASLIQDSAKKIYWNNSQVINILLAYILWLNYPESIIKEIIWVQKPTPNKEDCQKRINQIIADKDKAADDVVDMMSKKIEAAEQIIKEKNRIISELENNDTDRTWYSLWINALYQNIIYLKKLAETDPIKERNYKATKKEFIKYFGVEPKMENLNNKEELINHYLAYKNK